MRRLGLSALLVEGDAVGVLIRSSGAIESKAVVVLQIDLAEVGRHVIERQEVVEVRRIGACRRPAGVGRVGNNQIIVVSADCAAQGVIALGEGVGAVGIHGDLPGNRGVVGGDDAVHGSQSNAGDLMAGNGISNADAVLGIIEDHGVAGGQRAAQAVGIAFARRGIIRGLGLCALLIESDAVGILFGGVGRVHSKSIVVFQMEFTIAVRPILKIQVVGQIHAVSFCQRPAGVGRVGENQIVVGSADDAAQGVIALGEGIGAVGVHGDRPGNGGVVGGDDAVHGSQRNAADLIAGEGIAQRDAILGVVEDHCVAGGQRAAQAVGRTGGRGRFGGLLRHQIELLDEEVSGVVIVVGTPVVLTGVPLDPVTGTAHVVDIEAVLTARSGSNIPRVVHLVQRHAGILRVHGELLPVSGGEAVCAIRVYAYGPDLCCTITAQYAVCQRHVNTDVVVAGVGLAQGLVVRRVQDHDLGAVGQVRKIGHDAGLGLGCRLAVEVEGVDTFLAVLKPINGNVIVIILQVLGFPVVLDIGALDIPAAGSRFKFKECVVPLRIHELHIRAIGHQILIVFGDEGILVVFHLDGQISHCFGEGDLFVGQVSVNGHKLHLGGIIFGIDVGIFLRAHDLVAGRIVDDHLVPIGRGFGQPGQDSPAGFLRCGIIGSGAGRDRDLAGQSVAQL